MAGRSEARVFASIWKDRAFLALPPSAQRMYLFLLSQPDLSYCGVISLRVRRWARGAKGLTADQVLTDLKALAEPFPEGFGEGFPEGVSGPLIVVDEETEEVFVRSLIRNDGIWKQPNLLKNAREAASLVESPEILAALLRELMRIPVEESESGQVRKVIADFIADLEKTCPNPPANPSPKGSDSPSADPSLGDRGSNGDVVKGSPNPSPRGPAAPAHLRAVRDTDPRLLGNRLLDEHIQSSSPRPPRKVLQQTGAQIDDLVGEGIPADDIRAGLKMLRSRTDLGPGVLPNLVHQARTASPGGEQGAAFARPGRRSGSNVHHEHGAGAGLLKGF